MIKHSRVVRRILYGWAVALLPIYIVGAQEIYVGLSQCDITPPPGGKTTGYASAKPTDGVHDPLSARVVILKSSETTVAMVSWDLCIFNSPWLHEQAEGLGLDHLLIMNTHTHAGPDLGQMDFPSPEKPWRRTVEERVLKSIRTAQENMFPAFITAGEGHIQLGYNRLVRQRGGYALTHFENPERIPFGPVDPVVGVLRIDDAGGNTRCVLVGYACHPVVLGPRNVKLSADYPGVMRDRVEKHLGGDAMCVFVQGGAGDINPLMLARKGTAEDDFPLVETMGTLLADEVVEVLEELRATPGKSDELRAIAKVLEVPNRWDSAKTLRLGVTSILINRDIGIVTMPGEPFHRFQKDLRERSSLPHTFFFGYCNDTAADWPAYLPDLESAAWGGYGASDTTSAAVGAGDHLMIEGLAQLYKLRRRLKPQPQRHVLPDSE